MQKNKTNDSSVYGDEFRNSVVERITMRLVTNRMSKEIRITQSLVQSSFESKKAGGLANIGGRLTERGVNYTTSYEEFKPFESENSSSAENDLLQVDEVDKEESVNSDYETAKNQSLLILS